MKRQGRGGLSGREGSGMMNLEAGESKHCAGDKTQEGMSPKYDRKGEPVIVRQRPFTHIRTLGLYLRDSQ